MSCNSKEVPFKNDEKNQLKYVSTYKMGQIGITKLIEEPFKTSINKENNSQQKQVPINIVPSNTNTNTNNTNTNNTNTNTNTYKAIDNNSNKKIIKNHYGSSHNVIHIQSFSNINCYKKNKSKSNKRSNLINNNNDKKQKYESVKFNKKQFSKTTNNLGLYLNHNLYNKDSYKNLYFKNKIKSKSNNKIQSESDCSNYILSSRTPSSIKRNQKKYAISNLIDNEKNESNMNSFKKDNIYDIYLKTSNNLSCIDIKKNFKKSKEKTKFDSNYQLTEFNTYLKVRKRGDIKSQKHANSNIKTESNKLISSCFFNNEKKINKISDIKDNIYISQVLSTENNIKKKTNIKLIYDSNKNTNRLLTENNQKENKFFPHFVKNIFYKNDKANANKNNISQTNKRKNSSKPNLNNNKFSSNAFLNIKNKKNIDDKLKDNKEENKNNINNVDKNKTNNNKLKSRKNFSTNNSKKKALKDSNSLNKNNHDNIRYNSFVKVYNNHNIKNEQKKKEEINNSIGIKDLKFECPEEMHFFMVNLTHNCIYANSNF